MLNQLGTKEIHAHIPPIYSSISHNPAIVIHSLTPLLHRVHQIANPAYRVSRPYTILIKSTTAIVNPTAITKRRTTTLPILRASPAAE